MNNKEKLDFILESQPDYLSDWENKFIESIEQQMNNGKKLSWKQYKVLQRIFVKVQDKEG